MTGEPDVILQELCSTDQLEITAGKLLLGLSYLHISYGCRLFRETDRQTDLGKEMKFHPCHSVIQFNLIFLYLILCALLQRCL